MEGSAFDLGEIRDLLARGADAVQQVQAVAADDLVVGIDLHGLEEGVDGGAKARDGGHGGGEILGLDRGPDRRFGGVEGGEKGAFLVGFGEFHVGAEAVFDAVLFLGLRQDVARALEALGDALLAQGRGKEAAEAQFEAAEIIATLQRWGRLEGVFMTALWNTIDDDPDAYIRGIRRVFGLAPEAKSDGALTPRMFKTLSDVMPAIPAAIVCSAEIDDGIALPIAYRMA